MRFLLVAIIIAMFLPIGCQEVEEAPVETVDDLEVLVSWMTGSFSSAEQAAADSNFLDIRLEMVPIWTDRADGYWLYVEQAVASALDKPYRQRVYHVTRSDDSTFESAVYTMEEPLRFAQKFNDSGFMAALTPDSLTAREGCSIILKRHCDFMIVGSTTDQKCTSSLRGATYATSEVDIRVDRVISWDRGYDADGNQVWGAETGGYVFRRAYETAADTTTAP